MKKLTRIFTALASLALLGAVGAGALAWHDGYRMYAVQSGSMSPTYRTGDLLVDAPPFGPYTPGDVITFRSQGGGPSAVTTHRVLDVAGPNIETKGDANDTADVALLTVDDVVGTVMTAVPHGGYALIFFQQPTGAPALMAGLVALVLLWGLFFPDRGDELVV